MNLVKKLICATGLVFSACGCYDIEDVKMHPAKYDNPEKNTLEATVTTHIIFMKKDDKTYVRVYDNVKKDEVGKEYGIDPFGKKDRPVSNDEGHKLNAEWTFSAYKDIKFFEVMSVHKRGQIMPHIELNYPHKSEKIVKLDTLDEVKIVLYGNKYVESVELTKKVK